MEQLSDMLSLLNSHLYSVQSCPELRTPKDFITQEIIRTPKTRSLKMNMKKFYNQRRCQSMNYLKSPESPYVISQYITDSTNYPYLVAESLGINFDTMIGILNFEIFNRHCIDRRN